MWRSWGLDARATVALWVGKEAASEAGETGAPGQRSGTGGRRTLSRLLCLAAVGSASDAATAEEHLEHVRDGLALSRGDAG